MKISCRTWFCNRLPLYLNHERNIVKSLSKLLSNLSILRFLANTCTRCGPISLGKSSVVTKTVFAILVFIMDVAEENAEEKIQQETRGTDENETKEEDPKREITQTDHLNRRLLGAFLARLNSSESTGVLPSNNLPQMDIYEDEDFETDENCTDNRLFKDKNLNEAPKGS